MTPRVLFALVAGIAVPFAGSAADAPKIFDETIKVDGKTREYRLAVPAGKPAKKLPLLVAFHGMLIDSKDLMPKYTKLDDLTADGIAVVYPNAVGKMWGIVPKKVDEDLEFFDALVAHLVKTQPIDPDRVFVGGMSNGAYFAHLTAQKRPGRVAGVVAHSGGMDVGAMVFGVNAKTKFPVLIVHGTDDKLLKVEDARKARDLYKKEGHPVEYVEVPKLGHAWATDAKVNATIAAFVKHPPTK